MNLNDLEALVFDGDTVASELYNILNTLKESLLGWGQLGHDDLGHNLVMQGATAQRPTSADFTLPADGGDLCLPYWSTDELLLYVYDGEQWRNAGRTSGSDVSYTVTGYDTIDNVSLALDQLFALMGEVATDAESILYEFAVAKYLLGTSGNVEEALGLLADWTESAAGELDALNISVNGLVGSYGDLTASNGAASIGIDSSSMDNVTATNVHDAIDQIDHLFGLSGMNEASNISYEGTTIFEGSTNVSAALDVVANIFLDFPDCTLLEAFYSSTVSVGLLKKIVVPQAGIVGISYADVGVAPTGDDLIIQIRRNNAPEITITIADGTRAGNDTTTEFDVVVGDLIQIYVFQVGSTTAGSSLAVSTFYKVIRDFS